MNSKNRQNLKHNDLADALEAKIQQYSGYWSQIALGALLVVVAIFGIGYWFASAKQAGANQWKDFQLADMEAQQSGTSKLLDTASEMHQGKVAGLWALQRAADYDLGEGTREIFRDRTAGIKKIESARDKYKKVIEGTDAKNTMLLRRAHIGLGHSYESLGLWKESKAEFELLIKEANGTAIGNAAERGLARVTSTLNQEFYAEFKSRDPATATPPLQDPTGAGNPLGGFPGLNLPPVGGETTDDPFGDLLAPLDGGGLTPNSGDGESKPDLGGGGLKPKDSGDQPQSNTGGGGLKPKTDANNEGTAPVEEKTSTGETEAAAESNSDEAAKESEAANESEAAKESEAATETGEETAEPKKDGSN